ncbi:MULTISPECIES: copper chaperone PCu(A)C [Micromonospora]|uniref:Copper(I)-binding protein n=1 Tax=Micromonospora yangpuensis TaxID=683228 RepID=A0A1C6UTL9_9ACTN|nr:copper chaperone PCu(A)C [Micromonospora yangpuensis]GGM24710.1 hypothetical protein GCM10012279_48950 [Micromonospora yangpuensis]SCL57376.1 hypothetical protein GA0070617_3505 [Micromonospora yangpuensis]
MSSSTRLGRRRALLLAGTLVLAVAATGCGSSDTTTTGGPSPSAPPSASTPTDAGAGVLEIRDPWVKAADTGMTAAFATLANTGDTDVTLTGASTDVSVMEVHEMAMRDGKMVMKPKEGGVVIKAGSSHVLQPGGDHLMLMDLREPVPAGAELAITLTFADGRSQRFTAVSKPFTGAQESYSPEHGGPSPMPGGSATPGMTMSPAS